jgi:hypothetical protein
LNVATVTVKYAYLEQAGLTWFELLRFLFFAAEESLGHGVCVLAWTDRQAGRNAQIIVVR